MKKSLVSVLTTALVVGATGAAFAASNPFSDVPADHWSYDAVTQLAQDGVINGYGDGTYRGDKNITRYEMAQMVAKAMAKSDVSAKDKALIDKLAAEFSDELNSLGVRVANLEKHADKVKWTGTAWTQYQRQITQNTNDAGAQYRLKFRLEPTAEVNDHWSVKARMDANWNLATDAGANDSNVKLMRAWADGTYGKFNIKAGKIAEQLSPNLLFDTQFSGAAVSYGKDVKFTVEGGRVKDDSVANELAAVDANNNVLKATELWGFGLAYAPQESKWNGNLNYYRLSNDKINALGQDDNGRAETKASIWELGAKYRFDSNLAIAADYARNVNSDKQNRAWTAELLYKGAKASDPGSWGASLAYRELGRYTSFAPTYNGAVRGAKGWDLGAAYTLAKNVVGYVQYFRGNTIGDNSNDTSRLWGRLRFFF